MSLLLLAAQVLYWGGKTYPYWYVGPAAQATKCSSSIRNYLASVEVEGDAKDPDATFYRPWKERTVSAARILARQAGAADPVWGSSLSSERENEIFFS